MAEPVRGHLAPHFGVARRYRPIYGGSVKNKASITRGSPRWPVNTRFCGVESDAGQRGRASVSRRWLYPSSHHSSRIVATEPGLEGLRAGLAPGASSSSVPSPSSALRSALGPPRERVYGLRQELGQRTDQLPDHASHPPSGLWRVVRGPAARVRQGLERSEEAFSNHQQKY